MRLIFPSYKPHHLSSKLTRSVKQYNSHFKQCRTIFNVAAFICIQSVFCNCLASLNTFVINVTRPINDISQIKERNTFRTDRFRRLKLPSSITRQKKRQINTSQNITAVFFRQGRQLIVSLYESFHCRGRQDPQFQSSPMKDIIIVCIARVLEKA